MKASEAGKQRLHPSQLKPNNRIIDVNNIVIYKAIHCFRNVMETRHTIGFKQSVA
jgi:hypothetical protein